MLSATAYVTLQPAIFPRAMVLLERATLRVWSIHGFRPWLISPVGHDEAAPSGILAEVWKQQTHPIARADRLAVDEFRFPFDHHALTLDGQALPELLSSLRRVGLPADAPSLIQLVRTIARLSESSIDVTLVSFPGEPTILARGSRRSITQVRSSLERVLGKPTALERLAALSRTPSDPSS